AYPGSSGLDKNSTSTSNGGPWTPRFEALFEKAGMSMQDPDNIVNVVGHRGPHPEAYHEEIYRRLIAATRGLSGKAFGVAFRAELRAMGAEIATPGTYLHALVAP